MKMKYRDPDTYTPRDHTSGPCWTRRKRKTRWTSQSRNLSCDKWVVVTCRCRGLGGPGTQSPPAVKKKPRSITGLEPTTRGVKVGSLKNVYLTGIEPAIRVGSSGVFKNVYVTGIEPQARNVEGFYVLDSFKQKTHGLRTWGKTVKTKQYPDSVRGGKTVGTKKYPGSL